MDPLPFSMCIDAPPLQAPAYHKARPCLDVWGFPSRSTGPTVNLKLRSFSRRQTNSTGCKSC